jgi:outer membrane protein
VKNSALQASLLAFGLAALAYAQAGPPPTKVGIIHIQNTVISTKDGQKAFSELQARFEPRRKEIEKKQAEITALRDQLQKGSNTLSEDARQKLVRDIDQKTRALNRDTEDAQSEYDQEQQKVLQELGEKIMAVIYKYAQDNGYAVILDISSPQTPVLYAANNVDLTNDIVSLYDKSAPAAGAAPATGRPMAFPPAGIKPASPARPPARKQP